VHGIGIPEGAGPCQEAGQARLCEADRSAGATTLRHRAGVVVRPDSPWGAAHQSVSAREGGEAQSPGIPPPAWVHGALEDV